MAGDLSIYFSPPREYISRPQIKGPFDSRRCKAMSRPDKETLSQYVSRVIAEKGLSLSEVKLISGAKITDGYIRSIMKGRAKNPSVEKLKALALGLGVAEEEIFRVARGLTPEEGRGQDRSSNYQVIFSLMCVSLRNRTIAEILQEVARLTPASQEEAVKVLMYLNDRELSLSKTKKTG